VVGIGDAARTRHPAAGDPSQTVVIPGDDSPEQAPAPAPEAPSVAAVGRDQARGEGPLDGETGPRRFDTEAIGSAADDRWLRAASNEPRPGRMDLAVASAPGVGVSGHGPGERPGAALQGGGVAPAVAGARADLDRGSDLAMNASEREYQRFRAEIGRRVRAALLFPKRLALMLQQGEVVVQFVVRPDGRLAGAVRLLKSAGFEEFDSAAVAAVTRAAPFPRMTRELSVSMPIAFDNPVIR
jgi:protein TonB